MDAVQFGRWLSERRRKYGWQSQRAFVDTAQRNPHLSNYNISEDFLARLEAGHFVHPFRGTVRQRVLLLAWLLCKAPRDLRTYLRAAELTELSADETSQLNQLNEYLAALHAPSPLLLPLRPTRFVGRSSELQDLMMLLRNPGMNVCAVTGMPGIGKSALAYEAVHLLASNEFEHLHLFPDGVATFNCTGRRSISDLIALLHEIRTVFQPSAVSSLPDKAATDLAYAIDCARSVLSGKRVLLLLDDLEANFPLRQALEALYSNSIVDRRDEDGHSSEIGRERRFVLITSRYVPSPALVPQHLHLAPLKPDAALELLSALIGRTYVEADREYAEQVCRVVGYLPLAIEVIATAVITKGIPLSLLATHVAEHPLDRLLDSEGEIRFRLDQALRNLDQEMQEKFALLATLGAPSFGLESAAAITSSQEHITMANEVMTKRDIPSPVETSHLSEQVVALSDASIEGPQHSLAHQPGSLFETTGIPLDQLAGTAADLGQFVRYSLLELAPGTSSNSTTSSPLSLPMNAHGSNGTSLHSSPHYWLHPLLRASAMDYMNRLDPQVIDAAQRNIQAYALNYLERYKTDVCQLVGEHEFLLAAMEQAWHQGQHTQVIQFIAGLSELMSHLSYEKSNRLLLLGIHASQQVHDRFHLAVFLNRLGLLDYNYRGDLARTRRIWEKSLEIAESLDHSAQYWSPLTNLAHIAHMQREYDAAQRFTEAYLQHSQEAGNSNNVIWALFNLGLYTRLQGDKERAYNHLRAGMQLLSLRNPATITPCDRLYELLIKVELARVQGNYACSQKHTEAILSLLPEIYDPLLIAELVLDQADFAQQEGMVDDARALARRVAEIATQFGSNYFHTRSKVLLQHLSVAVSGR